MVLEKKYKILNETNIASKRMNYAHAPGIQTLMVDEREIDRALYISEFFLYNLMFDLSSPFIHINNFAPRLRLYVTPLYSHPLK